jgi:endonuclease YncB( thermonuclease family)
MFSPISMEKKNKKQRGAIQLPVLIVIIGIIAAGAALYRRGELFSLMADISQTFSPEEQENLPGDSSSTETFQEEAEISAADAGSEEKDSEAELGEGTYVLGVIDGDTIILEGGERVKYIGVDAPETVNPSSPVECFGRQAAYENKNLVAGKRVRLESDGTDQDKDGNLLRYVWVGDTFVNYYLIEEGFAQRDSLPSDSQYSQQLVEAEAAAKKDMKGLWKACEVSSEDLSLDIPITYDAISEMGGCTDPAALNFNWKATFNDGSCRYPYRPVQQTGSQQDTIPPKIENVQDKEVGTRSATITWTTDEPSTSRIQYGKTLDMPLITPFNPELSLSHSVVLENLDMGSTYYYRIISADASNNWPIFISRAFTTLHINGELSVETMSLAPEEPIVIMGEQGEKLGMWRFNANDLEDIEISQVIVYNKNIAGAANALNLELWCGGNPMEPSGGRLVSNNIVFNGGKEKCIIPRGDSLIFTLYGDVALPEEGGVSDEKMRFFLELPNEITGSPSDSIIAKSEFGYSQTKDPGEKIANPVYSYRTMLNVQMQCFNMCAVRQRDTADRMAKFIISSSNDQEASIESITLEVSGDIKPSATQTVFYLDTERGERVGEGVFRYSDSEVNIVFDSQLTVTNSQKTLILVADTQSLLVRDESHLAENLNIAVDRGSPEEAGGFRWYDEEGGEPISWVYSVEPIGVNLGY